MNGIIRRLLGRSVQLVVMATPTHSLSEALDLARRSSSISQMSFSRQGASSAPRASMAGA